MKKKLTHKSYLQMVKEFNDLLKEHNINKSEYIKPASNILYYNVDDVVEGNENIDILICPICYNIIKDPISCNSTEKSHSFCKVCILKSLKINDKCPICKQTFEYATNKKIKELLKKLKFKCKYAEEGCHRILDYQFYFIHLDKCEFKEALYECQVEKYNYDKKILQKCNYEGTFIKLMKHFKNCAFLKYKCLWCNNNIFQINFKEHFSSSCKILIDFEEDYTYTGQHDAWFNQRGFGKKIYKDGEKYEGEFKDNKANGFGIFYREDGKVYKGEWKNGLAEGIGLISHGGQSEYQGEFKDGYKHGIGIHFYKNFKYEGEFKNSICDGYGITLFTNDKFQKYEGEWKNDEFEGYGILYYTDGSIYNGEFKKSKLCGFGIKNKCNKEYYIGQFKNDFYDGYGKVYLSDSKKKIKEIKGKFKNNVLEGYAIEYFSNGNIIEGYWKNGRLNGVAFLYTAKGEKYIKYYVNDEEIFSEKID